MRVRQEDNGKELLLDGEPLGRGGEAAIYAVPGTGLVAKVYHKPTPDRADKLKAMLADPPADPMAKSGHASIAWPVARLIADVGPGLVVGYLMPHVDHGRLALEFYNPRSRQQLCPMFHYRYLVRTAHNLAAAVRALHEKGYVVGDLNESNVLVTNQALVALVDTDSFQVPAAGKIYRCRVGKPEYTPPELQGARFTEIDRGPEHDAFGLAVLIFQMLMQGTHPFTGMAVGAGESTTIPRRIAEGHWPYTQGWEVPVRPSPHAPPWEVLPPPVQTMMRRCFEDGYSNPTSRPNAIEWQRALLDSEQELTVCAANSQHVYHRGLAACPWCVLAQQHGRDPFPSIMDLRAKNKTTLKLSPASSPEVNLPLPAPTTAANGQGPPPAPATPPPPAPANVKPAVPIRFRPTVEKVTAWLHERGRARMTAMRNWPRSRWAAVGAGTTILVLALFLVVPRVWSILRNPKPEEVVAPGVVDVHVQPREEIAAILACKGHAAKVMGVVFLPDGSGALSCGADNLVRQWDLASGQEIRHFTGHTNWVMSTAVTGDGTRALSASADKTLRLWNVATGTELNRLEGHVSWINAVALSADGRRAISASDDAKVGIWESGGGSWRDHVLLPGHVGEVTCVAITPDGKHAVSGGADHLLRLWDLEKREMVRRFYGHTRAVTGVAVGADGRRALSGSKDRTVRLWDVATGNELIRFEGHSQDVAGVALSPDGRRALSVGSDHTIRLWDVATGQELSQAPVPVTAGALRCVAFSPDGRRALSGGDDGLVRYWSLPGQGTPPSMPAPSVASQGRFDWDGGNLAERIFFLPDGKRYLVFERNQGLYVRDLVTGAELFQCRGHADRITAVAVSDDGRRAITGGADRSTRVWDLGTGQELRHLANLGTTVSAVAISADGSRALFADTDNSIVIWNLEMVGASPRLRGHVGTIAGLALSPDGRLALSAAEDGTARIWDCATARELRRFSGFFKQATCAAFSPGGRFAVLVSAPPVESMLLWDVAAGRIHCFLGPGAGLTSATFSADGRLALTTDRHNRVSLWDVDVGQERCRLAGPFNDVLGIAFSPNGRSLVTADRDSPLRTWPVP